MKRINHAQDLVQYQFEPEPGKAHGLNVYSLLTENHALLIDTGYEEHAKLVLEDLHTRGYSVSQVVLSHFHPDHVFGLQALKNVRVFGSEYYAGTLGKYPPENQDPFMEIQKLTDGARLQFGGFQLAFHSAPGHSPCSMYTVINDSFIHVADTLIAANDGQPICPFAEYENIGEHILSLERLMEMSPQTLLLGHGKSIEGKTAIKEEITDRLIYLRAIRDSGGKISFKEATIKCTCRFLNEQWHIQLTEEKLEQG